MTVNTEQPDSPQTLADEIEQTFPNADASRLRSFSSREMPIGRVVGVGAGNVSNCAVLSIPLLHGTPIYTHQSTTPLAVDLDIVRKALLGAINSLEYIQNNYSGLSGWGVRDQRIEECNAALTMIDAIRLT